MASSAAEQQAAEALSLWEAAKASNARLRNKISSQAEQGVEMAAVIGGGAVGGYMDREYADKDVLGIKASIVVGGAATAVGAMEWAGKQSGLVGHFGLGVLAYEAGAYVAQKDSSSAGEDESGASSSRRGGAERASDQRKPFTAEQMRQMMGLV